LPKFTFLQGDKSIAAKDAKPFDKAQVPSLNRGVCQESHKLDWFWEDFGHCFFALANLAVKLFRL
jgi:hypothetical protein